MRSNEYYEKNKVISVILISLIIYLVSSILIGWMVAAHNTAYDRTDFITNYDLGFKRVVTLESISSIKNDRGPKSNTLADIEYDPTTLYLDWSAIEAKRAEIEAAKKAAEEEKRKNGVATDIKPNTELKVIPGSLAIPDIPNTAFKGYMCIHKITSKSSMQYKFLQSGDFELHSDQNGIMMYKSYYIVAMGSYYTNYKIGSTFRITLDTGITFDVITGDEKADCDTDSSKTYRPKGGGRGEIIEFIIACGADGKNCNKYHTMSDYDRSLGNLSSIGFQGNVVKIEKLDDNSVVEQLYGKEISYTW